MLLCAPSLQGRASEVAVLLESIPGNPGLPSENKGATPCRAQHGQRKQREVGPSAGSTSSTDAASGGSSTYTALLFDLERGAADPAHQV